MRDVKEKEIEKYLVKKIKELEGECVKFESPGYTGVPDRIIWLKGLPTIYVELKRPTGGRFSARQELVINKLRDFGYEVYTLKNKFEVDNFILFLRRRVIRDKIYSSQLSDSSN